MYEKKFYHFRKLDQKDFPPADANLFVGSSSIRRWHSLSEDMLPKVAVNRGFGGSDMKSLHTYYDHLMAPYCFSNVFIYEGDNDLASRKREVAEVMYYFQLIEARIQQQCPRAIIHYLSIKSSPARRAYWHKYRKANRLFQNYCAEKAHLNFIDIASVMQDDQGEARPELFNSKDGIHPNEAGYKRLQAVIYPYLFPADEGVAIQNKAAGWG